MLQRQDLVPSASSSPPRPPPAIPVLSFFTGLGFLDLGFQQAGFTVLWSNELNPWFASGRDFGTRSLLGNQSQAHPSNLESITTLGPNQIAKEAFNGTSKPPVFGIIGGPPCPDFSVGGKNRGGQGDHGKLSQVYVNRILELEPTFFLLENVPGILRTRKHAAFFKRLREQLATKFTLSHRILNALDFGVPQDRDRVFLVGFNNRWFKRKVEKPLLPEVEDWFPWPRDARYAGAKSRFPWPEVCPIGTTPEKPANIPDELMVGPQICDPNAIRSLPNGTEGFRPRSKKFKTIEEGDDSRKSFKRLHRWRYSPTAAYGNNEVHLHPVEPRRITVREALRIQSVPDTFALPVDMPLSHKFKGIGNGVPVRLANAMARAIETFLRDAGNGS